MKNLITVLAVCALHAWASWGIAARAAETIAPPPISSPLTVEKAVVMLAGLRALDGRSVNGTTVPWDFASGALRMRISNNIAALEPVERAREQTRKNIVAEILKQMPPDKEGRPAFTIPPGTREYEEYNRQISAADEQGAQATLSRIKASELRLDKNEIPGSVLSALRPILDDDVSPK